MSSFSKIIESISQFGYPHAPNVYSGESADRWFVYNYADNQGEDFADDEPGSIKVSLQLHLYLPFEENYLSLRDRIREALFAQDDFTYPVVTDLGKDAIGKRHLVFEFDGWEARDGI